MEEYYSWKASRIEVELLERLRNEKKLVDLTIEVSSRVKLMEIIGHRQGRSMKSQYIALCYAPNFPRLRMK